MADGTLVTLTRHLIEEQRRFPESRGEFSNMFLDLTLALKIISREVMKAGLVNILGETPDTNIQGETVMKLDRFADDRIFEAMDHGGHLCCMATAVPVIIARVVVVVVVVASLIFIFIVGST